MGNGRRRRSYSDSSELESDSDASSSEDEAGRHSNSGSDQEADNWVLCDRCTKWRRIPALFADQIKEDTPWYCEQNPNKAFASCSVPQELTNEEIDAEDSDGPGESDHDEESLKRRRIPAVWQLLKDNVLAHRKRKVQDEDDIMICHCKPVYRGGDGCGPDCINRMLCIECVPGFCPSEDKCTNQMFSKRMYANLEIRRAGAKGFGLFALEDIKAGQFIIEYIGEVLEEDEYQRRKDYYMSVGQRHYYFMNIGNGEVIDACRKGNISRFINHSCEPNCETQKWLVRGELAIGLFAVRDIPKETELTFDYNFERYGDKPMRCYCGSTNCRKFIGGMQDNFDVALLPAVEPEESSMDLPPVMLKDADMDPNMRMLLEWRVGAKVEKAKELGMITRLERICKARDVPWTVKHFYGQEAASISEQQVPQPPPQRQDSGAAASSARSSDKQATGEARTGSVAAKGKQQRKVEKAAAGATAAGPTAKGKTAGSSATKQQSEGSMNAGGAAKVRTDDGEAQNVAVSKVSSAAPAQSTRQPPASTPEIAQVRGPKALFKQWKIMQQQDAAPAHTAEEKAAVTPSSPTSPQSPLSPPSPQCLPSPRSQLSADNDDAALDELRTAATEAAKHVPLRKRLRRLPPKVAEGSEAAAPAQNGASTSQTAVRKVDVGVATAQSAPQAVGPARKLSTAAGLTDRTGPVATGPPSPLRSSSPPPSWSARGGYGTSAASNRKLRSEIDRRLEEVVGSKGGIKDPSRQNIIKVLRLFNLCDIGGHPSRSNGFGGSAGGRYLPGSRSAEDGMAGPGPGSSSGLTARQRARMADLSLLLDVVLKTTSSAAKKELVACGLLTQLHQAMGRNTGKEYCVILRKVLRAVEGLPLEANDVYAVRSAHGTFADMLRQLSSNADYDVRTKATALLKKFPPSAVTDQRLLQLMSAPPVRFGHGRGSGGGMRMGGFPTGGMMPLALQQQYIQQQQLLQQQIMKQQLMRLKESAMAANNGGLPPPPPLPGGLGAGADATGSDPMVPALMSGCVPRTVSTASVGDDAMDVDQVSLLGPNGPAGLPPLGPHRPRSLAVAQAAAAALASRPGLLRPLAVRTGGVVTPGLTGLGNTLGTAGMGTGAAGLSGRNHAMGLASMASGMLGLPPRPPSPANVSSFAVCNSVAGEDAPANPSKRRRFSAPVGGDSPLAPDPTGAAPSFGGSGMQLPGPPPRPPYSLVGGTSTHRRASPGTTDAADANGRDPHGPPATPQDLPLPPPPPHPAHGRQRGGRTGASGSEERDLLADLPERLSVEQFFALQRPLLRPPPLPPLQGRLQPERHLHGELTDIFALFALGVYGSYHSSRPSNKTDEPAAASKPTEQTHALESASHAECEMSPIIYPNGPPLSPLLDPPPPPTTMPTPELPPPPPVSTSTPLDSAQPRPVCLHAGPSPAPHHQQNSPGPLSGWDGISTTAPRALGSATAPGLGPAQPGQVSFTSPTAAGGIPTTSLATANGLPPVVPVSSLSEWRMPQPQSAAGTAAGADGVTHAPGAAAVSLAGTLRASPHVSPEHPGHVTGVTPGGRWGPVPSAPAAAEDPSENIDEWLRPVSNHHAEVWDEPNSSFEAYVADMVRHRLGKYMQPEHPSRVSVQEATMLRAKVYREVVAKERRAWEERRSAGVYKPIERHKLEANLKEFVRSTIKRMRDREKERAGGQAAATTPGTHGPPGHGHHGSSRWSGGHQGSGAGTHHHQHHQRHQPTFATPGSSALPPTGVVAVVGGTPQMGTDLRRQGASPIAPGTSGRDELEQAPVCGKATLAASGGLAGPGASGSGSENDVAMAEATAA